MDCKQNEGFCLSLIVRSNPLSAKKINSETITELKYPDEISCQAKLQKKS